MVRLGLQPALAEISQLSRLILTATPEKLGRSVVRVKITWEEKEIDQRRTTLRELDRPRVGRMARREGTAETVAPDAPPRGFPASGSIRGDAVWDPLAREHVNRLQGGHVPDLRILAESFRSWCAAKDIPLNARTIDKTFIGFCRSYKPPE
ncbi:hypothetical protein [Ruegeria sp.]|uniref:hypothetical protein n=1 Tax=Ruegeria sp. TaxID=1879320 RepID=UPI003B0047EA